MFYTEFDTPLGPMRMAGDDAGLRHLDFLHGRSPAQPADDWVEDASPMTGWLDQMAQYLMG